ncbi:HesA/MoeB/ThiF family protein, partial [Escherichia coli]
AGGLGSPVLLYLSAAGVGYLTILDDDVVDESNLQRQVIHRQADVGRPKALSAKDAVQRLNPHLVAEAVVARLGTDNALDLVKD